MARIAVDGNLEALGVVRPTGSTQLLNSGAGGTIQGALARLRKVGTRTLRLGCNSDRLGLADRKPPAAYRGLMPVMPEDLEARRRWVEATAAGA